MSNIQFVEGLFLGLGLLVALGPKDTFVIKNSVTGGNALMLIAICGLSDVLLILFGVVGLGAIVASQRWLKVSVMSLSIVYLLYFSANAFLAAYKQTFQFSQENFSSSKSSLKINVLKGALFHSLLTPFAWVDTVLVIGALSTAKIGADKYAFAGGAMVASFIWFMFLTMGSQLAAPLLRNRRTWQVLELIAGSSMFILAITLILGYPWS
jgi:L-lysine exporter family protein LysE/ArgO